MKYHFNCAFIRITYRGEEHDDKLRLQEKKINDLSQKVKFLEEDNDVKKER